MSQALSGTVSMKRRRRRSSDNAAAFRGEDAMVELLDTKQQPLIKDPRPLNAGAMADVCTLGKKGVGLCRLWVDWLGGQAASCRS